jgi:hypothetical protein
VVRSALLEAPRLLGNVGRAHAERHLREPDVRQRSRTGADSAPPPFRGMLRIGPGRALGTCPLRTSSKNALRTCTGTHASERGLCRRRERERGAEGVGAGPLRSSRPARAGLAAPSHHNAGRSMVAASASWPWQRQRQPRAYVVRCVPPSWPFVALGGPACAMRPSRAMRRARRAERGGCR